MKVKQYNRVISNALIGVLLILLMLTIFSVFKLNILSVKVFLILTFLLVLITILVTIWLHKSKGIISKVIASMLIIALSIGTGYISKIDKLLNKTMGANTETHIIHVMVLKDSDYLEMQDLEQSIFGINIENSKDTIESTIAEIEYQERFALDTEIYETYPILVDALLNTAVDVILLPDAHKVVFEELSEGFKNKVRVIKSYEIQSTTENAKRQPVVDSETFSIYVSGIDTYGPINSVSNSDVNMIVTVNPLTHQILLTSIPRDYHIKLHSYGKMDKLTHSGIYGVNESMMTLEDLLNENLEYNNGKTRIDIDYYLRVNFTSVVEIVDALGGVEVNSEFNFKAGDGTQFNEGINTLNGRKALSFVRHRKRLPNGDFDRIKNQQALISGVIDKILSPSIITNLSSFITSIENGFQFSMTEQSLNDLIKDQLDSNPKWEINSIQLTGTGSNSRNTYTMPGPNLYVTEPNVESVKKAATLIHKMELGETIVVE